MRNFFAGILSLFVTGCVSMAGLTPRTMINVTHDRAYKAVDTKGFNVTDDFLSVSYTPDIVEAGIPVVIINNSKQDVEIDWNKSYFLGPNKRVQKLLHSGVKIIDRNKTASPTLVPAQAKHIDELIPVENVYWREANHDANLKAQWLYLPLCGKAGTWAKLEDENCLGKTFTFVISYRVGKKLQKITLKYRYESKSKKKPVS